MFQHPMRSPRFLMLELFCGVRADIFKVVPFLYIPRLGMIVKKSSVWNIGVPRFPQSISEIFIKGHGRQTFQQHVLSESSYAP